MTIRHELSVAQGRRQRALRHRQHRRFRPSVDALEERQLLSTFTVTNTIDDGSVGSLRWAIGQANATTGANTIVFDPTNFATPRTITLSGSNLELSNTTGTETIQGPGSGLLTINGNGKSEVLVIDAGAVAVVSGLTITGGYLQQGGNIYSYNLLNPGPSKGGGGGIANNGSATISDSIVTGNNASARGGGIYNTGTIAMNRCVVSNNVAEVGGGLESEEGTATLTNCTFTNNRAARGGGAGNIRGTIALTGCTFVGNTATSYGGGALASAPGYAAPYPNVTTHAIVTDCTFTGNGVSMGGGIYGYNFDCTISGSTFNGNTGGAIVKEGGSKAGGDLRLSNSTICGNTATAEGNGSTTAGVYATGGTNIVTNCTITSNSIMKVPAAKLFLPALVIGGKKSVVNNTIVAGNTFNVSGVVQAWDMNPNDKVSGSNNLIGTGGSAGLVNGVNGNIVGIADPRVAPLGNYGGPTQTIPLLPGSPAIDAGSNALAVDASGNPLKTDQRGAAFSRTRGDAVDIGAFELQTPVDFASGFATGTAGVLTFNGGAAVSGSRLRLTDGGGSEARSVFTTTPQSIAGFTTSFAFQIGPGANTADGFTFTVEGVGNTALGPGGGGLGYGNGSAGASIARSLAVKFDLYDNAGEGNNSTGVYSNGASPTTPDDALVASGVDLHRGDVMNVTIQYDGTSNLALTITDTVTGGHFTKTYTGYNIPQLVGGNTAYVGFTAGTGGLTATQEILAWTFTPAASESLAPRGLTATAGASSIALAWTAPAGVVATYNVYRGTVSGGESLYASGVTATSYFDTAVSPNTTYYYTVTAVNAGGESAASSETSAAATGSSVTLDFSSGFATGAAGVLTFNGGAAVSGSHLRLTDGGYDEARSVFSTTPQNITAFTTRFSFQINPGASTADGFTFTIQGVGNTALGSIGGGLGYASIAKSLAVKFDLYNNAGEGNDSTGVSTNGAFPATPDDSLVPSGVDLHSGDVFNAKITYSGSNLTLTISDSTSGRSFTKTYAGYNIPQLVGGSTAYVGFTGGTGGLTANQSLLGWTYSTTAS